MWAMSSNGPHEDGLVRLLDGFVAPLTLRTYWSAAAWTLLLVAGGSKLWSVLMLRTRGSSSQTWSARTARPGTRRKWCSSAGPTSTVNPSSKSGRRDLSVVRRDGFAPLPQLADQTRPPLGERLTELDDRTCCDHRGDLRAALCRPCRIGGQRHAEEQLAVDDRGYHDGLVVDGVGPALDRDQGTRVGYEPQGTSGGFVLRADELEVVGERRLRPTGRPPGSSEIGDGGHTGPGHRCDPGHRLAVAVDDERVATVANATEHVSHAARELGRRDPVLHDVHFTQLCRLRRG